MKESNLESPPPKQKSSKLRFYTGFTLAEVLITLGVIGIVAVLTIPQIIDSYNKKAWAAQLQKTVSTLEQGFQKMLADDGVELIADTHVLQSIQIWHNGYGSENATGVDEKGTSTGELPIEKNLSKYFKIVEFMSGQDAQKKGYNALSIKGDWNLGRNAQFILSDGSMVSTSFLFKNSYRTLTAEECALVKAKGGKMCVMQGYFYIDVNGLRGPNRIGRDIFAFFLSERGYLYPNGGIDYALYSAKGGDYSSKYWRTNYNMCGEPGKQPTFESTYTDEHSGILCAARVVENGWVIDF